MLIGYNRHSGFDMNYVKITKELREKYPAPPGYRWQNEDIALIACLKKTNNSRYDLIMRPDFVELSTKQQIKTEGLEASVQLVWSRALFEGE